MQFFFARKFSTEFAKTIAPSAHVEELAGTISNLTLLETKSLVELLRTRLNIQMPMGTFNTAAPAVQASTEPAKQEEKAEKLEFKLTLESFDATSKAKTIKEVKLLTGLSLVDSKNFVESLPKVLKPSVKKEEADEICKTMAAIGAKVTLS